MDLIIIQMIPLKGNKFMEKDFAYGKEIDDEIEAELLEYQLDKDSELRDKYACIALREFLRATSKRVSQILDKDYAKNCYVIADEMMLARGSSKT